MPLVRLTKTEGVHVKPTLQLFGPSLETRWLTRQCDRTVSLEPVLFVLGGKRAHALALSGNEARLFLEGRIGDQEAIVMRPCVVIEEHFDDAKAFVNRIEERAISQFGLPQLLFAQPQRLLCRFALGDVPVAAANPQNHLSSS